MQFDSLTHQQKAVQSLIAQIQEFGIAKPMHGHFYRTFNHSLVFVFDSSLGKGEMQLPSQPQMLRDLMHGQREPYEPVPAYWEGVVIRGGHPYKEVPGCETGSRYLINKEGGYSMTDDALTRYPLCLGVYLKKPIMATKFLDDLE
jgi:hypothetical protein